MITIDDVKNNRELINDFIIEQRKLVTSIVNRYFPTVKFSDEYEDILQIANIGLYKAIEKFDVNSGNQFSTYAVIKIIGEVRNHFRSDNNGCLSTTTAMRVHWRKYLYLSASLGYSDTQIADELKITIEDIDELKKVMRSVIKYEDLKNNNNGEDIGGIENLAPSSYNLEKECMYNIELEDKTDMLKELLPSKYIKVFTLRLNGMNRIDISKKIKCTANGCSIILDRLYRTIKYCVNPYYDKEISFVELKRRLKDILMIESGISVGGNEMAMSFNICKATIKKWAVTNPGQSIKVRRIIEEAGYVIDGSIALSVVKREAIEELKEEGHKIIQRGTAFWVDSIEQKEELEPNEPNAELEPKEIVSVRQNAITVEEMRDLMYDLVQGLDVNFDKIKDLITSKKVQLSNKDKDSDNYILAIRNKIIESNKIELINNSINSLSLLADDNGKKLEITLLVKEVD